MLVSSGRLKEISSVKRIINKLNSMANICFFTVGFGYNFERLNLKNLATHPWYFVDFQHLKTSLLELAKKC